MHRLDVRILDERLRGQLPHYATGGSAGLDLRAGFAYVLAGLMSQEEMVISGVHFVKRGYENLLGKLQGLGAQVEQVTLPGTDSKKERDLQPILAVI
jgi:dUTPase